MSGNQTQIPVIQSSDASDLTQIQQNTNKVLRNIYNQLTTIQIQADEAEIIGEIKVANISVSTFQSMAGTNWVLCDGASCVGSSYSQLTGNNNVPNVSIGSFNSFIRIN